MASAYVVEPLLDQLAEIFHPARAPWWSGWVRPDGLALYSHERCEAKRLAIARAAAQDLDSVREHADLVLRAIVHDTCRSGNRQLIQVALRALGTHAVLEALIGFVESGDKAEQLGATMAMYWAHPAIAYELREVQEHRAEIMAIERDLTGLRARAREACLQAFLTYDDPGHRADLSLRFILNPAHYPATWAQAVDAASHIARDDPVRYDRLLRTRPAAPEEHDEPRVG